MDLTVPGGSLVEVPFSIGSIGDFSDEGDFFPPEANQKNQVSAPRVYLEGGKHSGAMEVWIYPRSGHSWGQETIVFGELYDPERGWEEYGRNVRQDAP